MDNRNYEIAQLNKLNQLLIDTCGILAERSQRVGFGPMGGLSHTQFVPTMFGVPTMGIDPRGVIGELPSAGFTHSPYYPYGVYPSYGYTPQSIVGWPGSNVSPTYLDPFYGNRVGFGGLSHTAVGTPWSVSPYEIAARQRDLQAQAWRQQYEAMAGTWRPFGG